MIKELTFIDVETTGRDVDAVPPTDAIVEVAVARVDLMTRRTVAEYEALIQPWGPQATRSRGTDWSSLWTWNLGLYHVENHHFDGVDWDAALPHATAMHGLRAFLADGVTVAGQNPGFDLRYLSRDYAALGWQWPKLDYHVIDLCSPALFLAMAGETEGMSLRHTVPWAQAGRQQTHRAMADVRDAITVFWAMYDRMRVI